MAIPRHAMLWLFILHLVAACASKEAGVRRISKFLDDAIQYNGAADDPLISDRVGVRRVPRKMGHAVGQIVMERGSSTDVSLNSKVVAQQLDQQELNAIRREEADAVEESKSANANLFSAWAAREWAHPDRESQSEDGDLGACRSTQKVKATAAESWFSFQRHNQTIDAPYALSEALLNEVWTTGTVTNMRQVAKKIQSNRTVRILTLGGSFTRGMGSCEVPTIEELPCAWPNRLQQYLRDAFPDKAIEVVNRADHGVSVNMSLQSIGADIASMVQTDSVPDVVIMDGLVNDVSTPPDAEIGAEALIRVFQDILPKAQLVLVTDGCPECVKNTTVVQTRQKLVEHYQISALDYAGLVLAHNTGPTGRDQFWPFSTPQMSGPFLIVNQTWPNFVPATQVNSAICCPGNHPPWPVHRYMSDALGYGFLKMLSQACQDENKDIAPTKTIASFHSEGELSQYESCARPITFHSSKDQYNMLQTKGADPNPWPVVKSGDWKLFEDMRGRPGWIATRVGSVISFPVRFGSTPYLSVAYLRSYAHIGNATFRIEDAKGNVQVEATLDGHWEKRYSLPHVLNFHANKACRMMCSDCAAAGAKFHTDCNMRSLQHGEYNIVFEVAPNLDGGSKVKLLSVSTC